MKNEKICFEKRSWIIGVFFIAIVIFIFLSYSINKSHTLNSRASFSPSSAYSLFTLLGLNGMIPESSFTKKYELLKKQIDENPQDNSLKVAFSAFIESHIAIAGGYAEHYNFAASNLYHYLYGNGEKIEVSKIYRSLVSNTYESWGQYFTRELSYSLTNGKNLQSSTDDNYDANIGMQTKTINNITWKKMQVLLASPLQKDLTKALGKHTIYFSSKVLNSEIIQSEDAIPSETANLLIRLKNANIPYKIRKITISLSSDISLFDIYQYQKQPVNAMFGTTEHSDKIASIISVLNKWGALKGIKGYMDKDSFNELVKGNINVTESGLAKLEELTIAKRYEINGTIKQSEVADFPIYLIVRE